MSNSHLDRARAHLEAAQSATALLAQLYAEPHSHQGRERIAEAHQHVRIGHKAAEVNALIAIAEALTPPERAEAEAILEPRPEWTVKRLSSESA